MTLCSAKTDIVLLLGVGQYQNCLDTIIDLTTVKTPDNWNSDPISHSSKDIKVFLATLPLLVVIINSSLQSPGFSLNANPKFTVRISILILVMCEYSNWIVTLLFDSKWMQLLKTFKYLRLVYNAVFGDYSCQKWSKFSPFHAPVVAVSGNYNGDYSQSPFQVTIVAENGDK